MIKENLDIDDSRIKKYIKILDRTIDRFYEDERIELTKQLPLELKELLKNCYNIIKVLHETTKNRYLCNETEDILKRLKKWLEEPKIIIGVKDGKIVEVDNLPYGCNYIIHNYDEEE